jgi:hypothetical protein
MKRILVFLTALVFSFSVNAQEVKVRIGTEFPLQHFVGINYQHNEKFSADFSYGINDTPYNDELYDWIRVPSDKESLKDFLKDITDDGNVLSLGVNYHKDKWYFGVKAQYIKLYGSGSYRDIINSDLVREGLASGEKILLDSVLSALDNPIARLFVNLEDEVRMESSLFQLGLKVGREFQFKNPKLSMNLELGLTANMSASTKTSYDQNLVSALESFALNQVTGSNRDQILENIDLVTEGGQLNEFFEDYAYIPSLSIGLAYSLYKKEK